MTEIVFEADNLAAHDPGTGEGPPATAPFRRPGGFIAGLLAKFCPPAGSENADPTEVH